MTIRDFSRIRHCAPARFSISTFVLSFFSPCFPIPLSFSGVSSQWVLSLGSLLSSVRADLLIELLLDLEILRGGRNPLGNKAFRGMLVSILPSFGGHSAVSGWAFLRIRESILPKVDVLPNLRKPFSRVRRGVCPRFPIRRRTDGRMRLVLGLLIYLMCASSVASEDSSGAIRCCRMPLFPLPQGGKDAVSGNSVRENGLTTFCRYET